MEFRFVFHDDLDFLEVIAEGKAEIGDYERIVQGVLNHPKFRKGLPALHDQRAVTLTHFSQIDIRIISDIGRKYFRAFGTAKWAIVMPSDVQYGIARMWQTFLEDYIQLVPMVFRTREEAIRWLREAPPDGT